MASTLFDTANTKIEYYNGVVAFLFSRTTFAIFPEGHSFTMNI